MLYCHAMLSRVVQMHRVVIVLCLCHVSHFFLYSQPKYLYWALLKSSQHIAIQNIRHDVRILLSLDEPMPNQSVQFLYSSSIDLPPSKSPYPSTSVYQSFLYCYFIWMLFGFYCLLFIVLHRYYEQEATVRERSTTRKKETEDSTTKACLLL